MGLINPDGDAVIDERIAECKGWQEQCFSNFTGPFEQDNRMNCLELFGFNKSSSQCIS